MKAAAVVKTVAVVAVLAFALTGCSRHEQNAEARGGRKHNPKKGWEKWHQKRLERLQAPDGWLSLVGLYWLHDGPNTFGSDKSNQIVMPAPAPAKCGTLVLANGAVTLEPAAPMTIDGQPVKGKVHLISDGDAGKPTIVSIGSMTFQIIKRSDRGKDRYGVRVKDPNSPTRTQFAGLQYFPFDEKWRTQAEFIPYNPPKQIAITDVTGATSMMQSPGALAFTVDGQQYRLDAVLEQGEKDLFIIFRDATSKDSTYPAARYLYAEVVRKGGWKAPDANAKAGQPSHDPKDYKFIVDFNRAYNPPCAFTHFATCPLPPPQNVLPIRIEAGEKRYQGK